MKNGGSKKGESAFMGRMYGWFGLIEKVHYLNGLLETLKGICVSRCRKEYFSMLVSRAALMESSSVACRVSYCSDNPFSTVNRLPCLSCICSL